MYRRREIVAKLLTTRQRSLLQPSVRHYRPPKSLFRLNEASKLSGEKRMKGRAGLLESTLDLRIILSFADTFRQLLDDGIGNSFRRKDSNQTNRGEVGNTFHRGWQVRDGWHSFSGHNRKCF